VTDDGTSMAHPIEFVPHGSKQEPWQIDGITGATISSKAMAAILRRSTADWIPLLRRHLDDFRKLE
jgi:electron transport complex protein RnfG